MVQFYRKLLYYCAFTISVCLWLSMAKIETKNCNLKTLGPFSQVKLLCEK